MPAEPCYADQNLHQVKLLTDLIDYVQQGGLEALNERPESRELSFTARQCCLLIAVQCITAKLGGGVTLSTLAKDLHMTPSAASHLVDTLVAHDMLERSTHADDRRSILITLTPAGRRYAAVARRGMLRAIHELTTELTPEENELRRHMVEKLYRKAYPDAT